MIRIHSKTLTVLALLSTLACVCKRPPAGIEPPGPTSADLPFTVLDARQKSLLDAYPGAQTAGPPIFWASSLNQSQRVEFAGGTRAMINEERFRRFQAIGAVTAITGEVPSASSADEFNTAVVWSKDAAKRFSRLRCWGVHLAVLHPGQYGYQENRDGNPFLGMVVLFDEKPADPNKVTGQFHIGFRSFFGHYEAENGDIGNKANYQLYKQWYGPIPGFEP
jgi:hypothetical protein